jgi:hypothetical protein
VKGFREAAIRDGGEASGLRSDSARAGIRDELEGPDNRRGKAVHVQGKGKHQQVIGPSGGKKLLATLLCSDQGRSVQSARANASGRELPEKEIAQGGRGAVRRSWATHQEKGALRRGCGGAPRARRRFKVRDLCLALPASFQICEKIADFLGNLAFAQVRGEDGRGMRFGKVVDGVAQDERSENALAFRVQFGKPPDGEQVRVALVAGRMVYFPDGLPEKGLDVLDQVVDRFLQFRGISPEGDGSEEHHEIAPYHRPRDVSVRVLADADPGCSHPAEEITLSRSDRLVPQEKGFAFPPLPGELRVHSAPNFRGEVVSIP